MNLMDYIDHEAFNEALPLEHVTIFDHKWSNLHRDEQERILLALFEVVAKGMHRQQKHRQRLASL